MLNYDNVINNLGYKAKEKVTGISGVITSISFDLYGCIQYLITPPKGPDNSLSNSVWFDRDRLVIDKRKRVMAVPDFNLDKNSQISRGPELKPDIR